MFGLVALASVVAVLLILFRLYAHLCMRHLWLIPAFVRRRKGWSKIPSHRNVRHVSHRGGAGERLENTLAAFRNAVENANTDVVELDVQLTADGIPVVCHDRDLRRLCGVDADVRNLDAKELPRISAVLVVSSEPDLSVSGDYGAICTLKEVFQAFPEAVFNIDLKSGTSKLADAVAEVVVTHNMENNVVWGSDSNLAMNRYLRRKLPQVAQFCATDTVLEILLYFWSGLLPFVVIDQDYFQPPLPHFYVTRNRHKVSFRDWILYKLWDLVVMRKLLFDHLSQRGIPTWIWTANHDWQFEQIYSCGADAVITDYPIRLRQFLDRQQRQ